MMLVHGEQYLELHKPLPVTGKLINKGRIVDVVDKGKGTTVTIGVSTYDEKGNLVCENEFTNFIRGMGGFGGTPVARKPAAVDENKPPSRAPDAVVKEVVNSDQAALYRLSGDYNPLHIDPEMSKMGGFDVPILHGLCTFGIAGKHVLKTFGKNDSANFKSIKVRFAKHVFPGETLETQMWKEGSKVYFNVRVVERDVLAISNAAVELREGVAKASSAPAPAAAAQGLAVSGFMASKVFEGIEASLKASSEAQRKEQVSKVSNLFGCDCMSNFVGQGRFCL